MKQKQYCNKSNKDFKNGLHQKKKKILKNQVFNKLCILCAQSLGHVRLFATPWTAADQAPQSMGFFQARVLECVAISFFRGSS